MNDGDKRGKGAFMLYLDLFRSTEELKYWKLKKKNWKDSFIHSFWELTLYTEKINSKDVYKSSGK